MYGKRTTEPGDRGSAAVPGFYIYHYRYRGRYRHWMGIPLAEGALSKYGADVSAGGGVRSPGGKQACCAMAPGAGIRLDPAGGVSGYEDPVPDGHGG